MSLFANWGSRPKVVQEDPNSDAVRQRLQKQADIPHSPVCPICWENLCGFDSDAGSEYIAVAWNACGHSFHQSCIEATLRISATTADGLRYKVGKCAVCSKGQALLRKRGDVSPYSRIWLSTQDRIDTDVLPLTIRFDDQTQTNLNIIALAGLAKTDVDTIKAALEKHLGAFEPECSGTVKALQTSSSSFFTAIQDLERLLTRVKRVQAQDMLVASVQHLEDSTTELIKMCEDSKRKSRILEHIAQASQEISALQSTQFELLGNVTKLDAKLCGLKTEVSDTELLKSERLQLLCLDKELSLQAQYQNQLGRDRQEMKAVVCSLERKLHNALDENFRLRRELKHRAHLPNKRMHDCGNAVPSPGLVDRPLDHMLYRKHLIKSIIYNLIRSKRFKLSMISQKDEVRDDLTGFSG